MLKGAFYRLGRGRGPSSSNAAYSSPVEVKVSLAGVPLGSFVAGPTFETFRLPLPRPLPVGSRVLRLDVAPWRPGDRDGRELGVMVDRVEVEADAHAKLARSATTGGEP
jgi:hypothetical protein